MTTDGTHGAADVASAGPDLVSTSPRWGADPRYPAMFRAELRDDTDARLVWDGAGFRVVAAGGVPVVRLDLAALRRLDVVVEKGRAHVSLTLDVPRTGAGPGAGSAASTSSHVVLDVVEPSLARFRRFVEALGAAHPHRVSLIDVLDPPAPPQREYRVRRPTTRRGVFARTIWSRRTRDAAAAIETDVVDQLERLAVLRRRASSPTPSTRRRKVTCSPDRGDPCRTRVYLVLKTVAHPLTHDSHVERFHDATRHRPPEGVH